PDDFVVRPPPFRGRWRRERSFAARSRRLAEQPFEAPRQHLAHHAEVVARRERLGADVELAVLVLAKTLGPRDDHGADRIAALNVAVIVDLDAEGGFPQ